MCDDDKFGGLDVYTLCMVMIRLEGYILCVMMISLEVYTPCVMMISLEVYKVWKFTYCVGW